MKILIICSKVFYSKIQPIKQKLGKIQNKKIPQEKSCGCIVIDNNKVLLVKHNAGHWDFPKGHMEQGETEQETAIRETKEETNIEVEIITGHRYTTQYSPKENTWKEVVYFVAQKKQGILTPQVTEVEKVEWVELEKAKDIITYESSKEILIKVIEDFK